MSVFTLGMHLLLSRRQGTRSKGGNAQASIKRPENPHKPSGYNAYFEEDNSHYFARNTPSGQVGARVLRQPSDRAAHVATPGRATIRRMDEQQPGDEGAVIYTAGQAAQQLGVSPSGLRRLAAAYEAAYKDEPLPREPHTQARGYPAEAVERIRAARRYVESGNFKSTEAALSALRKGYKPEDDAEMAESLGGGTQGATGVQLGVLIAEMRAMRAELERLRAVVEDRDREQALPPGATPERIDRAIVVELEQPAPPEDPEDDQTGAGDGVLVRAARWLESRLGGGRRG